MLCRFPHIDILQYFEFLVSLRASVNEPSIFTIHRAVVCQTFIFIKIFNKRLYDIIDSTYNSTDRLNRSICGINTKIFTR